MTTQEKLIRRKQSLLELDQGLYLYFRYAKAAEVTFGDTNFHREVVASEMDSKSGG